MSRLAVTSFLIIFISATIGATVQHELNDVGLIDYSSTSSPSASISMFSVAPAGNGNIDLSWEITGIMEENDNFKVYVNGSEEVTLSREYQSWRHSSLDHGESFSYTVKICNAYGCNSTEGSGSAIADNEVDPASGAGGLTFTKESTSILIAWTTTNTSDVNNWLVCWDEETFSYTDVALGQITCEMTGEVSQSHSLPKKTNSGTHSMYVSVGGMDSIGNTEYNGQMGDTQYINGENTQNNGSANNGTVDNGTTDNGTENETVTSNMTACELWEYWHPELIDLSVPGHGCPDYVGDGTGGNETNGSFSPSGTQGIPSVGMVGTIVAICVGFISTTRRLRSEDKKKYT